MASPANVRINMNIGGAPSPGRRAGPSHYQLDILRRQRQAMRRQGSYSDVVNGIRCASSIEVFQYTWHVLIILLGLGMLCMGLYFLYYQENARMVPTLAYYLATFSGPSLALVSCLGLYGLQRQRRCITDGRRNYAFGLYILLSLAGSIIIITGGVIALTLRRVADTAEANDFSETRVIAFETAIVTMLDTYVQDDPGGWRGVQNTMYCCGYVSVNELVTASKSEWDPDVLTKVANINSVYGNYCAKKNSECSSVDGYPCPAANRDWCREEVLGSIVANFKVLGIYAILIGACEVVSALFALFTLLCDVRMVRAKSPIQEIPRFVLQPVGLDELKR